MLTKYFMVSQLMLIFIAVGLLLMAFQFSLLRKGFAAVQTDCQFDKSDDYDPVKIPQSSTVGTDSLINMTNYLAPWATPQAMEQRMEKDLRKHRLKE